ncbi:MAG: hypothetical protein NVS2B9_06250 [Myxococcales bacterium]
MTLLRRVSVGRSVLRKNAPSPFGILLRGLVAGAAASLAQNLFFGATARIAPAPTKVPPQLGKPEPQARKENGLETVSRRLVDNMMKRGPLEGDRKQRVATAIHYGFGAVWGGVYALLRESMPALPASLFGLGVWMASDNLLLPAFRVSAWPQHYTAKEHVYAANAHIVYGLATAGAYALLRDVGAVPLAALPALVALQARAWWGRTPPGRVLGLRRSAPQRFAAQWVDRVARA